MTAKKLFLMTGLLAVLAVSLWLTLEKKQKQASIDLGAKIFKDTALYVGPNGSLLKQRANGISCSNCHMEGGRKEFALPLTAAADSYPRHSRRYGAVITLADRINACFRNPLNSFDLPKGSEPMRALVDYIESLSSDKPLNKLVTIRLPERAASPERGRHLYQKRCASCHQPNGQGKPDSSGDAYVYPPVFGSKKSFLRHSTMTQTILLARFIKGTMPPGVDPEKPALTDEEAFDVAALLVSTKRPSSPSILNLQAVMYPDLTEKPIDFPVGPYADPFPQSQHLYGPYRPILKWYEKHGRDSSIRPPLQAVAD